MITHTKTPLRVKNQRAFMNLLIIYSYILIPVLMSYLFTNQHFKTSLFYCAVILFAVMFASFAELTQRNKLFYNFFMFLSFLVLFFIYGFRDFSAIDDPSYIKIFENVGYIGWVEQFKMTTMEPGYLLLNYIVNLFTDNYLYMQLLTSFIPLALFYYGFSKYRKLISIPTAVFLLCSMLYFQMLSVALVRMFISLGITFIAFRLIPEQKPKKYMLYVFVATLFHYSSFFMILLTYFAIDKDKLAKNVTRKYLALFIVSPFLFMIIARFIVPLLGSRYSKYGSIDFFELSLSTITTIPLIVLLLLFYKRFENREQLYFKLFVTIYALSLIISIFGGMVGLGRLIFYSYASFILSAAMINKKYRFNSSKILFSTIIVFYGFLYLFHTQFTNVPHEPFLYPYENIFFKL